MEAVHKKLGYNEACITTSKAFKEFTHWRILASTPLGFRVVLSLGDIDSLRRCVVDIDMSTHQTVRLVETYGNDGVRCIHGDEMAFFDLDGSILIAAVNLLTKRVMIDKETVVDQDSLNFVARMCAALIRCGHYEELRECIREDMREYLDSINKLWDPAADSRDTLDRRADEDAATDLKIYDSDYKDDSKSAD